MNEQWTFLGRVAAGLCLAVILGAAGCIPSAEAPQEQAQIQPPVEAPAAPVDTAPGADDPNAPPLDELLAKWETYAANPALYMDDLQVRQLVGDLAYYHGSAGWQPLYDSLGKAETDPMLKIMITKYLASFAQQIALDDSLLELTKADRDETTRACATHILAQAQDLRHEERFKELAQDDNPRVRLSALIGLASLGNVQAQDSLAKYYWQPDASVSERENVLVALTRVPREADEPIFVDAVKNEDLAMDARLTAVLALGQIGGDSAVALLDDLSKNEPDLGIRQTAVMALKAVQERQELAPSEGE